MVKEVEVEKIVEVAGETVVEVVEVEKIVEVEKQVDVERVVEKIVIPTPEPVRVDSPHITSDPEVNEWPTIYDENGNLFPKPSSFKEAPLLAARVAAGELPPVEERLPENPLVLQPTRGIGKYGGTWYRGFTGPADGQNMERPLKDHLLFYEVSGLTVQPNIAESWTQNEDATEFTFTLRKGHKWSDGEPFTTADIMFWVDHMLHNEELNPAKPAWTQKGGETLKFEAIDEQTFKVTSPEPYAPFVTWWHRSLLPVSTPVVTAVTVSTRRGTTSSSSTPTLWDWKKPSARHRKPVSTTGTRTSSIATTPTPTLTHRCLPLGASLAASTRTNGHSSATVLLRSRHRGQPAPVHRPSGPHPRTEP